MKRFFSYLFLVLFVFSWSVNYAADKKDEKNVQLKNVVLKGTIPPHSFSTKDAYLEESFEGTFPPTGWTLEPGTGDDWQQDDGTTHGPGSVVDGSYAIYFNDYSYSSGTSASIITPAIDLSSATAPQLDFYYWDGSGSDFVQVMISTDDSNYTDIFDTPAEVDSWTKFTVPLSDYVGQTVKIKFVGTSVYGYSNPHIDLVTVAEAPTEPIMTINYDSANFG